VTAPQHLEPRFNEAGLIPGIVQDAATGKVLMLGWLTRESLELTRTSGLVTFWSRSRNELWRKGETSGNTLEVVALALDCDGDALLITARPAGPTCHTGAVSCFDVGGETTGSAGRSFGELDALWETIARRAVERPEGSYTARLLDRGVEGPGRKVAEEATEVLLAAKDHDAGTGSDQRVAEEAADLVYHLLVLLAERGIDPDLVLETLADRRR
jgi:phosphoribosyl-ATP pyrophosphohydrolase/phosphoribosyl-AMP cyclohydrolase